MKKIFLRRIMIVFLMATFIFLPVSGQTQNNSPEREQYVLDSKTPSRTFPIMRPDDATIRKWQDRYEKAPRAHIDERYHNRVNPAVSARTGSVSSANLLDLLTYSPDESQGSCGNCWAWTGTRVMGIDLNTQTSTAANLSVQFANSCYGENACCGGWLSDIVDFYNSKMMAIPISNSNAAFQEGNFYCNYSGESFVPCLFISTSFYYSITSIEAATVTTTNVLQETAISNIKNVLNQGKAIYFAFYLPNNTAWNNFYNFWNNQSESALWDPDTYCDQTWNANDGGGHAVTLVGYDDSSSNTDDHHWIVVNSWGTTANRPNGIFRMKMYANYECAFPHLSAYALEFQTLNIGWGSAISDTAAPTITAFTIPGSSTSLTVGINSFTATDDVGVTGYMVTNSLLIPIASSSGWSTSAPISYTFSSSTTSGTKTLYAYAKDAAGNVSASMSASVTLDLPKPDLIVSAISNKSQTVRRSSGSRSFTVSDTTKNQGAASSGVSTTKYYLSTTTSKTTGSVLLSGVRSVAALAAGRTSSGSITVSVPSGIPEKTYYVIGCADASSLVSESDESNNCKASSTRITVKR